jgi:hypothetical protein
MQEKNSGPATARASTPITENNYTSGVGTSRRSSTKRCRTLKGISGLAHLRRRLKKEKHAVRLTVTSRQRQKDIAASTISRSGNTEPYNPKESTGNEGRIVPFPGATNQ